MHLITKSEEKKYVWQGLYYNTMEHVSIEHTGSGHTINGIIIGEVQGMAMNIHYKLHATDDWTTQSVAITVDAETSFSLAFQKDQHGGWSDGNGNKPLDLAGCIDVDISMTPFTNTLTINRSQLDEGASEETNVVYIDVLKQTCRSVGQRYTRVGQASYKYENLESEFMSVVETDEDGIVINYPGIWRRIYPMDAAER
ncbi:putative glycolipid-binding domain-containing protein [Parapedobacter tibetensis]|uniref:putative glycolipid-binding domain-containing protein n=1 Tax=Parapedobacter tibetensis TaxID=2972951 RepID=UPI00214D18B9|nr:putative glycolipid-binding domain-containing protein [Parapedobacter tibetensis]